MCEKTPLCVGETKRYKTQLLVLRQLLRTALVRGSESFRLVEEDLAPQGPLGLRQASAGEGGPGAGGEVRVSKAGDGVGCDVTGPPLHYKVCHLV